MTDPATVIQRFTLCVTNSNLAIMNTASEGEYVRYTDHLQALKQVRAAGFLEGISEAINEVDNENDENKLFKLLAHHTEQQARHE